nr:hypothetical protein [Streptomyces swartbergensis]
MLRMNGRAVDEARLAFGGVATRPWRSSEAEAALRGQALTRRRIAAAGRVLVRDAQPREDNEFKVELVQRAVSRSSSTPSSTPRRRGSSTRTSPAT